MNKPLLFIGLFLYTSLIYSQIGINTDGTAPRPGTLLDIKANQTPAGTDSTVVVTDRGFVGIGTTSPAWNLDVAGKQIIRSNTPNLYFEDTSAAATARMWQIEANKNRFRIQALNSSYTGGGRLFDFIKAGKDISSFAGYYNGNIWFSVNNDNQRLGIGTSAPATKLHIHNDGVGTDSAFVVTGRGYAGLGTTSPTTKLSIVGYGGDINTHSWLDVKTNNSADQWFRIGRLGTAADGKVFISNNVNRDGGGFSNDDPASGSSYIGFDDGGALRFAAAGLLESGLPTERMRIDTSGHVGIGTTSPSAELEVLQDLTIPERGIMSTGYANSPNASVFLTKKGRGTSSSPAALVNGDQIGSYRSAGYDGASYIQSAYVNFTVDNTVSTGVLPVAIRFGVGSANYGTEAMRIASSGRVGIGTTAPSAALDVATDAYIGANYFWSASGAIELGTRLSGNRYSYIDFHGDDTYSDYGLRIIRDNTGPNADSYLQHRGTGILSLWTQEAAPIKFITSSTDRMIITAGGNVGIGPSAAPPEKLTVAGNIAPATDNTYDLGTVSLRWDDVYATNGTIQTSDKRLKTNIKPLNHGLAEVLQMKPVSFNWIAGDQRAKIGFLAQDMQALVPQVVLQGDDAQKTLGMNYAELVPVLVKALQQANTKIEAQQLTIQDQQQYLQRLEKQMQQVLQRLQQLEK